MDNKIEDFEDFFNEEMAEVWTGAAEFGYLVSDEEIATVPLERLMLLREEWPDQDDAVTMIEYTAAMMLDIAILACFGALGVAWGTHDKYGHWMRVVRENPDDTEDVAVRRKFRARAYRLTDGVVEFLDGLDELSAEELNETSDEWNAQRELMRAARAVEKSGDDPDDEWWEILGYSSMNDWKTRDLSGLGVIR